MQRLLAFPPSIRAFLGGFVVRHRRLVLLRAAGWAAYSFVLWLLLCCAADRILHFPSSMRLVLLCVGSVAALMILSRPMVHLWKPVNWVQVAQSIEARNSTFEQR